jgi:hypothetical protein
MDSLFSTNTLTTHDIKDMKLIFHKVTPAGFILALVNTKKQILLAAFGFGLEWAPEFIRKLRLFFCFYWRNETPIINKNLTVWVDKRKLI